MNTEIVAKLRADNREFKAGVSECSEELRKLDGQKLSGVQGELDGVGRIASAGAAAMAGLKVAAAAAAVAVAGGVAGTRLLNDVYQANQKILDDLDLALKQHGTTYEQQAPKIERFAEIMQRATNVDDDDIRATLATLVRGGYDLADAYKQVPLVMDVAAMFFNGSLQQAAETVTQIYQGRTRQLKSLGVDFRAGVDEVESVKNALDALSEASVGAWEKMQDRNPAAAISTWWGAIKDMAADNFIPAFNEQIHAMTNSLVEMMDRMDPGAFQQHMAAMGMTVGGIARGAGTGAAKLAGYGNAALHLGSKSVLALGELKSDLMFGEEVIMNKLFGRGDIHDIRKRGHARKDRFAAAQRSASIAAEESIAVVDPSHHFNRGRGRDVAGEHAALMAGVGPRVSGASPAVSATAAEKRAEEEERAREAERKRAAAMGAAANSMMGGGGRPVTIRVVTGARSHAYQSAR